MTNLLVDFYCRSCELDQTKKSFKMSNQWVSWHYSRCSECSGDMVRYIEDVKNDPYHYYSKKAKYEREKYRKDLIQPGQSGYQTLYGKQYKELETQRESRENTHKTNKKGRDKFLYDYKSIHTKQAALRAIELTEDKFESNA